MRILFTVIIAGLLNSSNAQFGRVYNSCPSPDTLQKDKRPKFSSIKFVTIFSRTHPSGDQLTSLIKKNPCQELVFSGNMEHISSSTHLVLYGTCDFNQMFRFSLSKSSSMECYHMKLDLWDPSRQPSRSQIQVANVYRMRWTFIGFNFICLGSRNCHDPIDSQRILVYLNHEGDYRENDVESVFDHYKDVNLTLTNRTGCTCQHVEHLHKNPNKSPDYNDHRYEEFWNAHCDLQRWYEFDMKNAAMCCVVILICLIVLSGYIYFKQDDSILS